MTVTVNPTVASYDDEEIEVGACTECLTDTPVDELTDCGTHRLCPDCLASTSCSGCSLIRSEIAADLAEQRSYDAWRDQQSEEDYR